MVFPSSRREHSFVVTWVSRQQLGSLAAVCEDVVGLVKLAIKNFATCYFFVPLMPVNTIKRAVNSMSALFKKVKVKNWRLLQWQISC